MVPTSAFAGIDMPATGREPVRYSLPNGLRVVLAPDPDATVTGVCVAYDVGTRSEPDGEAGLAHLFEHLMFQGSRNVGKLEHFRHVQGAGGTANGSTHLDHTEFYQVVPPNAVERILFLEADRMRGPLLTEANLRNQVDVVAGEFRTNVLSRPYGGFPAMRVPPALFTRFHNTHDGYGSAAGLATVTVARAEEFFRRHYAPGNAVLVVAGAVDAGAVDGMVEAHFGGVPPREVPAPPPLAEEPPAADRHTSYTDPLAPLPAAAIAWRVPDPVDALAEYLPYVVLNGALTDGASSRLVRRLVAEHRVAAEVGGRMGATNEAFTVRDPTCLVLTAVLPPGGDAAPLLRAVDEELAELAAGGLRDGELERVQARLAAGLLAGFDPVLDRARTMAATTLRHGDPCLVLGLARRLTEVTAARVTGAAAALRAAHRAVVEVLPAGRS